MWTRASCTCAGKGRLAIDHPSLEPGPNTTHAFRTVLEIDVFVVGSQMSSPSSQTLIRRNMHPVEATACRCLNACRGCVLRSAQTSPSLAVQQERNRCFLTGSMRVLRPLGSRLRVRTGFVLGG